MQIAWASNEHGRAGELKRLHTDRNNENLNPIYRKMAADAHGEIITQLRDRHLMRLRHRLMTATKAGDVYESNKIQQLMRDYRKEDKETGDYENQH